MTSPFFADDVTFLAECLDDHQDELKETLKSIQDLCKKDERFAILTLSVVENIHKAIHLTEIASLELVDAGMDYLGELNEG